MIRTMTRKTESLFWCFVILGILQGAAMAHAGPLTTQHTRADTVLAIRKRMRSRTIWEEIAYFPGRVVYFPLKYSFKALGASIGYIDDTKLIQKIDDFLTSDDGRRGLEPTGSTREWGASFYQKGLFGTPSDRNVLTITSTWGDHQRQSPECTLEEIAFGNGLIWADVLVRYRNLPTESFFGVGPDTTRFSDQSNFAQERASAEMSLGIDLPLSLAATALVGYDHTSISEGRASDLPSTTDRYTEASLPGLEEEVAMMHLQFALQKEQKDRPGNPNRGYEATVSGGLYQQSGDDRFGFLKYDADFTGYIPIIYKRVFAVRIAGEITKPFDGREIPFYYLSELGRKETIRGFERGRFRDRDMLLASAEYRYPIWRSATDSGVDFLLFADTGQVSPDLLKEAAMTNFQTGFGFGFRLWDEEGLTAKFEAGKSADQWRLYFALN